ncbi:sugar ABC transporter permease [Photobacterium gaetbulicola]|uniref:Sugar ABC transporter permease n=1 Tax=Photobacterium gaetbulicola TaxID=1295392 RepID=A0A0B9GKU4_9GAMM|nr:carbohydrate ABC transporter permease [Photobacterium gaetbulicola]KHT65465.1 sugar ABC transporter permease [Photobacterium gaetbulicola]
MVSRFHFNNRYQRILMYAVMLFLAYIFAFPLLFMLVSSFKPEAQIFKDLYSLRAILPSGELSLDNYRAVFDKSNIVRFFYNSMLITGVSVLLGLLINSMAAFALARLRWRGQAWILAGIIALLIVPFEAIVIPLLMLVAKLPWIEWQDGQLILAQSWLNSYHVQILPGVANAFSIFLFYQFFKDIPKDFDEAAAVDGATPLQIYWWIIVPMSKPVFATVAILQFLTNWNQYLWPVMVVQSESVRPVMVGMQQFFGVNTSWGEVMAYATLITLPVLAVFLFFQRRFVQSMAGAGIKG